MLNMSKDKPGDESRPQPGEGGGAPDRLSPVHANLMACILHKAADELGLLDKMWMLPPSAQVSLDYAPIEGRLEQLVKQDADDAAGDEHVLNAQKLQNDRAFAESVCRRIAEALTTTNDCGILTQIVNDQVRMKQEEVGYLAGVRRKMREYEKLSAMLQNEKSEAAERSKNIAVKIAFLKDDIAREENAYDINAKYLKKWISARNEIMNEIMQQKEKEHTNVIKRANLDIKMEIMAKEDIQKYLMEQQEDHQEMIEVWMDKYDDDVEVKDNEIAKMRDKIEKQSEDHQKLKELFELHRQEIEEFVAFKEERRREQEALRLRIWAATKIQAWWRGTMYRRKLGPYRKKKKKKKPKGKGKDQEKSKKGQK